MSLDLSKLDIPANTLRRLRYATFESTDEHGRTTFKHDPGISEGRLSSLSVDRGTGSHQRGDPPAGTGGVEQRGRAEHTAALFAVP
jgi:hypothetical protein